MQFRKIEVVNYQSDWPQKFIAEKALIDSIINPIKIAIEHIGSTSVPGLSAKPIIDILVEVSSLEELDSLNDKFENAGYKPKGEYGIQGRRYFQKGGNARSHHIHAFEPDNINAFNHRIFRDYLKSHPAISSEYAEIKKQAAKQCNHNSHAYMALKNDFIEAHLKKALSWHRLQQ